MRKVNRGTGMTAKKVTVHDTPEEINAFIEDHAAHATGRNIFESRIASIEEWAREQLAALGINDIEAFRMRRPLIVGASLHDRMVDYAMKVLTNIDHVRRAIASNNAPQSARFAVDIGEIFAQIQTTIEWEKFALRGKKIAESKRGPSHLYRIAAEIQKEQGPKTPAKKIYKELESRGEIIHGKPTLKTFSTQLSRHHKKSR